MGRKKIYTDEENKEIKRLYDIKYKEINTAKIKVQTKEYCKLKKGLSTPSEHTREKLRLYAKQYRLKNPDKHKEYIKNRLANDLQFKLRLNTSNLIRKSLKRKNFSKNSKSEEILGCTIEEFKRHIELQWESWMNWDNYGNPKDGIFEINKTWDIDHIIPTNDATNETELINLNHYTNLRPLCSYTNRWIKRDLLK